MLLQLVVSGIALGALYALVALSMTVVYRATWVDAQPEVFILRITAKGSLSY